MILVNNLQRFSNLLIKAMTEKRQSQVYFLWEDFFNWLYECRE